MNFYALLPLSSFLVNVPLAAAVLRRHPRGRANQVYAMLTMAIAIWSILKVGWRLCDTAEEVRREIRDTVVHELGHHVGLADEDMPY